MNMHSALHVLHENGSMKIECHARNDEKAISNATLRLSGRRGSAAPPIETVHAHEERADQEVGASLAEAGGGAGRRPRH